MPLDKERTIRANQLVVCPRCQRAQYMPLEITEGMLPVFLFCARCGDNTIELKTIPILPKVEQPRSSEAGFWKVNGIEKFSEDDVVSQMTMAPVEQANQIRTFSDRVHEIEATLVAGMQQINVLNQEIDTFEQSFFEHVTSQVDKFNSFGRWDAGLLAEFIHFPFGNLHIQCDNHLASKYCRLLFSPRFFNPYAGFQLQSSGGFQIELINQYSRMNFVINKSLCDYLEIPHNLDLQVIGSPQSTKIVGSSLPHCWKDIPGTITDHDHTSDNPSVRICVEVEQNQEAKIWLARHGIIPWPKNHIQPEVIRTNEHLAYIREHEVWNKVWQKFVGNGRLGNFSQDMMGIREFAVYAGLCIKGVKTVVLSRTEDEAIWRTLVGLPGREYARQEFIYITPDQPVRMEDVKDSRMVIVDHLYDVNQDWMLKLFDYRGHLLLLSSDPLMDCFTDNETAALVHALCGWEVYDYQIIKKPGYLKGYLTWDSPMIKALKGLQV